MKPNELSKLVLKAWAEDDRPREKLMLKGRSALTDAELIAILIGSGNRNITAVGLAQQILSTYDNNLYEVAQKSVNELMRFKGVGEAKAISIIAALELGRRSKQELPKRRREIRVSKDAFDELYPQLADKSIEEFWVVLLNAGNRVMSKHCVSTGGICSTVVDVRIIMKLAIENMATGILLAHNHPSGTCEPSETDKYLTTKIESAARVLDINVADHIVFAQREYYSFADNNLLNFGD